MIDTGNGRDGLVFRAFHSYGVDHGDGDEDRDEKVSELEEMRVNYREIRNLFSTRGVHIRNQKIYHQPETGRFDISTGAKTNTTNSSRGGEIDFYLLDGGIFAEVTKSTTTNYDSRYHIDCRKVTLISLDEDALETITEEIKERTGLDMERVDPTKKDDLNYAVPMVISHVSKEERVAVQ
jgi:hypothetical protein